MGCLNPSDSLGFSITPMRRGLDFYETAGLPNNYQVSEKKKKN